MKKTQFTYHDSYAHKVITLLCMIALVVMTMWCYIASAYMVISWFDTISIFTIPLIMLLIFVIGSILMSCGIMFVLLIAFVIHEHFEQRWEKAHEKINK